MICTADSELKEYEDKVDITFEDGYTTTAYWHELEEINCINCSKSFCRENFDQETIYICKIDNQCIGITEDATKEICDHWSN